MQSVRILAHHPTDRQKQFCYLLRGKAFFFFLGNRPTALNDINHATAFSNPFINFILGV